VGYGELMPCLEQVPGHRPAHVTQSYKANFHVVASLLLSGGWACCARRSRRGRRSYNVLGTATSLWEPCPWAGCSLGVLCTPFAAGALLLHPSVGALPVGERAGPWACWARRSQRGRCSYTPLWGPARGGKGGSGGALVLQPFVGAPPSGRMARSARPLSCAWSSAGASRRTPASPRSGRRWRRSSGTPDARSARLRPGWS